MLNQRMKCRPEKFAPPRFPRFAGSNPMALASSQVLQTVNQKYGCNPTRCSPACARLEQWRMRAHADQQPQKCLSPMCLVKQFVQRSFDRRIDSDRVLFSFASAKTVQL